MVNINQRKDFMKRRLLEEDFNNIKQLQDLKLKTKQIAHITGFSGATINRVKHTLTFADYKTFVKMLNPHNKPNQIVQTLAVDQPVETTLQIDHLERIADALERLATAWESKPNKKGWLK